MFECSGVEWLQRRVVVLLHPANHLARVPTLPTAPSLTLQEVSEPEAVKELIRKAVRDEMERLKVRRFTER